MDAANIRAPIVGLSSVYGTDLQSSIKLDAKSPKPIAIFDLNIL